VDVSLIERFLRAVTEYRMFEPCDKVLIAVSGGKDSFALLHLIARLKEAHFPQTAFSACTIETDITCSGSIPGPLIETMCKENGIGYQTIFFPISQDAGGDVDCFYCALRRRTALFKLAFREHYNKIAFGHHKDDMVETLLMNLMHYGNVSTMAPRVSFFGGDIQVLRPLVYVLEDETRRYSSAVTPIPAKSLCPGAQKSIRRETKQFLDRLTQQIPDAKENFFKVLISGGQSQSSTKR